MFVPGELFKDMLLDPLPADSMDLLFLYEFFFFLVILRASHLIGLKSFNHAVLLPMFKLSKAFLQFDLVLFRTHDPVD